MDRILQNARTTLSETWYEDGVAVDPGTVNITVVGPDGSTIQSGTASGSGAVARTFTLSDDDTTLLGVFTATWTSNLGTRRSLFEVVGAFYFSIAEFKAHYADDDEIQALTARQIADARTLSEDIIEDACNVAFVPRGKRIIVTGNRTTRIELPIYMLRSVDSASIDGDSLDITTYRVAGSAIYRSDSWPRNPGNVVLTVTHGFDAPPAHIKDAAMTLTKSRALKGPITDRATSAPAGDLGTITLLTPGVGTAITGLPDVDAAIIANRLPKPTSVSSVLAADASNTYPDPWEDFAVG